MSMSEEKQEQPEVESSQVEPEAEPIDEVTQLRRERDEFESKYLRAAADMQNYARRAQQNVTDARDQQLMDVTRALVTVVDHFDLAIQIDPEKSSAKDVISGVQMVRDELLSTLERFGVQRIDARRGDEFDPNRHEAVMRQAVEDLDTDHVAEQFQPGYALGDKTLRPAKVIISE